jgi:hypothetical protein
MEKISKLPTKLTSPSIPARQMSVAEKFAIMEQNSKNVKLQTSANPYVLDKPVNTNEEVSGEYEELEMKLESYQKIADLNNTIKKCVLILNAIVIPVILGVIISFYVGTSENKPSFADYAAAVAAKAKD